MAKNILGYAREEAKSCYGWGQDSSYTVGTGKFPSSWTLWEWKPVDASSYNPTNHINGTNFIFAANDDEAMAEINTLRGNEVDSVVSFCLLTDNRYNSNPDNITVLELEHPVIVQTDVSAEELQRCVRQFEVVLVTADLAQAYEDKIDKRGTFYVMPMRICLGDERMGYIPVKEQKHKLPKLETAEDRAKRLGRVTCNVSMYTPKQMLGTAITNKISALLPKTIRGVAIDKDSDINITVSYWLGRRSSDDLSTYVEAATKLGIIGAVRKDSEYRQALLDILPYLRGMWRFKHATHGEILELVREYHQTFRGRKHIFVKELNDEEKETKDES